MTNKFDKANMRQVIIDSPKQLAEGLELAKNVRVEGGFSKVIVCGMGGSALPADILNSLGTQIHIHKDYDLPETTDENCLVICISYSGNTEETLSALQMAITKKLKVVCMASGGMVEELSQKNNIPFVKIPSGIQPRYAIGYIFSALVKILDNSGVKNNILAEIPALISELEKINTTLEKEGQELAQKISNRIPVIYAPTEESSLSIARIWKIKFNENSKIPAFYNYFPELNHNEMVGYTNAKKDFFVFMLKGLGENERTQKRMALTAQILSEKRIPVEIITTKEGSLMFKIFSTLMLGDWVSYYLAINNKTDPTPVEMVEEFKKLLRK